MSPPVPLATRLHRLAAASAPAWLERRPRTTLRPAFGAAPPPPGLEPPETPAPATSAPPPGSDAAELAARFRDELDELRLQAEKEGLLAAQTKVETIIERYLDAIERLGRLGAEAARPRPADVVELALVVARELLGRELAADRERLAALVDEALRELPADAPVVVRLGRADLAYLRRRRPDLEGRGVVLQADPQIGVGGCVVETREWLRDATVETRLAAVRERLVTLLDGALGPAPAPGGDEEDAA
jgi:vacuolar-type H+-ATPase subunit E/Vma4